MAHVKGTGTTSLGRDSKGQRLGIKLFGGQQAHPGSIIVRQRGLNVRPGSNVRQSRDHSLFAEMAGIVAFTKRKVRGFNGKLKEATFVHVKKQ